MNKKSFVVTRQWTGSRCNREVLGQKPEVEIFWREIQKLVMGLFEFLFSIEYLISDGPFRKTPTLTSYSSAQQQTLIYALVLASLRPN